MTRFGRCKECLRDVPLDESTLIPGTSGLYECPDCSYPNDFYDFHGVYDVTETCSCGHLVEAHEIVRHGRAGCTLCDCEKPGYANIQ
jgi:hypothetical protein